MKTLKNTLGINKTKKTINSISSILDLNAMIRIKGGEGEDPYWPPTGPVNPDSILPIINNSPL
jgi:hypothetical protein